MFTTKNIEGKNSAGESQTAVITEFPTDYDELCELFDSSERYELCYSQIMILARNKVRATIGDDDKLSEISNLTLVQLLASKNGSRETVKKQAVVIVNQQAEIDRLQAIIDKQKK